MRRWAVSPFLPPAAFAAATLGLGVAPPQARTLASAATSRPLAHCSPPCPRPRRLCSSASSAASAATTALAVEEARRGRKQLGMDPPLYDYLLSNVREHPVLRDLREETATMRGSQMQVSPAQAQLLAMLVQILGAERCIEVGVYTGYSSLAVALALPESGRLVACERDERCLEVAKKYYQLAGVAHKVDVKHALAVDSLRSLLDCGEASSYDFAFVDADKRMYEEYFELLLKLVNDPKTISIRDFNKKLLEDKRVTISMVPIGDGMTICRKLEDD
ncbi:O-methyltransferase MdmC-like isoform X2 [Hordeum vulgare subsp. vulgare]|uniref:O-methyltransferase MdmC-like isoform X2 n=1 Tax=Hordeum vulgare subsp. vulgare TaxID=112509 RepID=UPI001D1A4C8B|nr:O-methyltransferase MdmC-like isoform X2 [Hordeum vulgare subsp. vulgare]